MKCNQSRPGFELVLPCPYPAMITITPRAPPKFITCSTVLLHQKYSAMHFYLGVALNVLDELCVCIYIYIYIYIYAFTYESYSKSSNPHLEKKISGNHTTTSNNIRKI